MESVFTTLDWGIFIGCLVFVMLLGIIAGWRERTTEDFYLAGHKIKWWGVAGSIFGSNISANHLVGMMGIGFSVGFAQAHFELGAIAGLMLLCFGFLPVYRRLNLYTLSQFLERRFDHRSRLAYALVLLSFMGIIQLAPALYIGSRSMCVMIGGDALQIQPALKSAESGAGEVTDTDAENAASQLAVIPVNKNYYIGTVVVLALVAATYTIIGGLKAVVITDVVQSLLLLAAGLILAFYIFDKIGGWDQFMAVDAAAGSDRKMRLYLPMNHLELPWLGCFTGLMAGHAFYWGTNQFIVQRALGAESDVQARFGIIIAGFTKLLIPFFSIAAGIAVYYLLQRPGSPNIHPDAAFPTAVRMVIPLGVGLVGLIAAGLIGAILSSIDSMLNSAATIFSFDIYQRYFRREASDRELILVGRVVIVLIVVVASVVAIFVLDANSNKNFFLQIADYQNYLTPGVLVVFLVGIFWKRATARAAFITIVLGVVLSVVLQAVYDRGIGDPVLAKHPQLYYAAVDQLDITKLDTKDWPEEVGELPYSARVDWLDKRGAALSDLAKMFGPKLNWLYRTILVVMICTVLMILLSYLEPPDPEKARNVWTDLGGQSPRALGYAVLAVLSSVTLYGILGWLCYHENLEPKAGGIVGALWTFAMFAASAYWSAAVEKSKSTNSLFVRFLQNDRLYAGVLCGLAIFILFTFS